MDRFISEFYKEAEIITPDDKAHYFFAYYDMRASEGDKKHLCHRVQFMDRLPRKDDIAEVGYLENRKFIPIAETTAWNFQQGALLQYHPHLPDTVYYNVEKDGGVSTVTHSYKTGEKKYTDRAVAAVSPDGKWGLAIDFGRIYDFRPGYGYAICEDKNKNIKAPKDDGVFLCDMETGKAELLKSYADILPVSGFTKDQKILINHITFNRNGDRFIMLVRNFPQNSGWSTSMMLGDLEGNIRTVLPTTYVSHYNWLDDERILAHCSVKGQMGLHLINTRTGKAEEYFDPFLRKYDIHCNYSPDGKYVIGDGYPVEGYRPLVAYSVESGRLKTLCSVKTIGLPPERSDIRCDLHARFVFGGKYISFDTEQNGKREIAIIPSDALDF